MTSNSALSFYRRRLKSFKTSTENINHSVSNPRHPLTISVERSNTKATVMASDMRAKLTNKADQMDEESSLFLLSITMRGTFLKVCSMEEVERLN